VPEIPSYLRKVITLLMRLRGSLRNRTASLRQKLFEPGLTVRQIGLGDGTGQGDSILVRDPVQDIDGGAIAQKDTFGVDGD
jgi:hypothetical protein